MDQYIVTVRNTAGRVSQVPTLAETAQDARTKLAKHWLVNSSLGMEILRVTFNRAMSL